MAQTKRGSSYPSGPCTLTYSGGPVDDEVEDDEILYAVDDGGGDEEEVGEEEEVG